MERYVPTIQTQQMYRENSIDLEAAINGRYYHSHLVQPPPCPTTTKVGLFQFSSFYGPFLYRRYLKKILTIETT
jgi:hypothetical protein